ncbi:unnamed protein product [Trichobilharzia szidati]|nr:unnamed protein product [Trichobilharzia szidati]
MNPISKLLKLKQWYHQHHQHHHKTKPEETLNTSIDEQPVVLRNKPTKQLTRAKSEITRKPVKKVRFKSNGTLSLKAMRRRKQLEEEMIRFDGELCRMDENLDVLNNKKTNEEIIKTLKGGTRALRYLQRKAFSYKADSYYEDGEFRVTEEELEEELRQLELLSNQQKNSQSTPPESNAEATLLSKKNNQMEDDSIKALVDWAN